MKDGSQFYMKIAILHILLGLQLYNRRSIGWNLLLLPLDRLICQFWSQRHVI